MLTRFSKKQKNPVVICYYLGYNRNNLKCAIKSCYFEPTDTLNGILILPYRCQASGFRPYAVEDRSMVAVTHLALLGVKIQDTAFRGNKREKAVASRGCFYCEGYLFCLDIKDLLEIK